MNKNRQKEVTGRDRDWVCFSTGKILCKSLFGIAAPNNLHKCLSFLNVSIVGNKDQIP